jgi:hypothetical protein
MDFRIRGLQPAPFARLFDMGEAELAERRALIQVADAQSKFPCRVCLEDVSPGTHVALVNFEHLPVESPYRATHAIFVSATAKHAFDAVNVVPAALRTRLLSLRAYDARGMMLDADVVEGRQVEPLIEILFSDPRVDFVHAHTARRGCYLASIERARVTPYEG